jgi:glutathione synthase/RimK-type ligase-like ATP-grasp enzyme
MGELVFEPYDLPKKISEQCITLVRRLGLLYGAIDFVHDPQGRIWFLEINPNGQWAFVDEHTTDNIGQAMANLLNTKN